MSSLEARRTFLGKAVKPSELDEVPAYKHTVERRTRSAGIGDLKVESKHNEKGAQTALLDADDAQAEAAHRVRDGRT